MFMLAKRYNAVVSPAGWWLSEKYDGWRVMWTGSELVTRDGNTLPAPAAWRAALPAHALDGELWLERGRFNEMQRSVKCSDWSELRLMVFDAPSAPGRFEERTAFLRSVSLPAFASVAPQAVCRGLEHLLELFSSITKEGGEGVMLRAAGSCYDRFRSPRLLKLKPAGVD